MPGKPLYRCFASVVIAVGVWSRCASANDDSLDRERDGLARQPEDRTQRLLDRDGGVLPPPSHDGSDSLGPASREIDLEILELDRLVNLSFRQRGSVYFIFRDQQSLLAKMTAQKRIQHQGDAVRGNTRQVIRDLLTPEQRKIYDVTPMSRGGGLIADPKAITDRLSAFVELTSAQQRQVSQLLADECAAQVAASGTARGFRWSGAIRSKIRAVLTEPQQRLFDVTPPYRSPAKTNIIRADTVGNHTAP